MIDISKLEFFDKQGYNYNFTFEDNMWKGIIVLPKVSVGLYATQQIFIMQKTEDNEYVFPYSTEEDDKLNIHWDMDNEFVDEIFLYTFDDGKIISETSALVYTPQDGPDADVVAVTKYDEYNVSLNYVGDETYRTDNKCLPIYIAFSATPSHNATTYRRKLIIEYGFRTIAEIDIFAESVDEDERLKVLCQDLGYKLTEEDTIIFRDALLNEPLPDFELLNQKRKEMLMEGHNIYPYVGSYKALVNAIKFFGYDNVSIIEFWRNVNRADTENFGKLFHSSKYSLKNHETLTVSGRKIQLPNSNYRKCNKIALVYDINHIKKNFDNDEYEFDYDELPVTEEDFTYTIEEAMIKLFALRRKLDKEFMPGSSKISDIIGEAFYFGLVSAHNTIDICQTNFIETGIKAKFECEQGDHVYITDDRLFDRYVYDKTTEYYASSEFVSDGGLDEEYVQTHSTNYFNALYEFLGKEYTLESLTADGKNLDEVRKEIKLSNTQLVKLYKLFEKEGYNKFFVNAYPNDIINGKEILELHDNDLSFYKENEIPVSAKIILKCTTFGDGSKIDSTPMDSVKYGEYSEIEWTIRHDKTGWTPNKDEKPMRGKLKDFEEIFIRLPYLGTYSVQMTLFDCYNGMVSKTKKAYITVDPLNIEISGIYHDARPLPNNIEYSKETQLMIDNILRHDLTEAVPEHYTHEDINQTLPVYTMKGEISRTGPYIYPNMEGAQWQQLDNLDYNIVKFIANHETARFIRNGVVIKPYTWCILGYQLSKIAGKKRNSKWTVTNEVTGKKVTHIGKYFTYLFKEEGNYTVEIEMNDTNNNNYYVKRNLIVVNHQADYSSYVSIQDDLRNLMRLKK